MATFLVVHPNLDIYGGGERVCHHVIRTLIGHGQNVELLTFDFDMNRYKEIMGGELPSSVVVHSLGKRMDVKPPFTVYKRRRNIIKLLNQFKDRLNYDYLFSTQSFSPFEAKLLSKAKKNIAYVHFPEIHFDYDHSSFKRKIYLWLFKKWVESGIKKLDIVLCNSNYTKSMIERYWGPLGVKNPIVVYPPINLEKFWCNTPLEKRPKRVAYVGRFIPQKRHEIIKQLACDLPEFEFVSIGGLRDTEKNWFDAFSENMPPNYSLKPNLSCEELVGTLQESRIYIHLMQGEHFGIAPIEALASGCITIVHNSGGAGEFIPEEYRWNDYADLKEKVASFMNPESVNWEERREKLWGKISGLDAKHFEENVWSNIEAIIE